MIWITLWLALGIIGSGLLLRADIQERIEKTKYSWVEDKEVKLRLFDILVYACLSGMGLLIFLVGIGYYLNVENLLEEIAKAWDRVNFTVWSWKRPE